MELSNLLRRFRPLCIGVVHDETALGNPIIAQRHPYTRHQKPISRGLGVAKHPRQGGQHIDAWSHSLEAGPADGIGHQYSSEIKCQLVALNGHQALITVVLLNGATDGTDQNCHI
jgi:hypothetical protein